MADPIGTIKNISELIKKYNDLELMKQIVALQTEVFDLHLENLALKKQIVALNERAKMTRREPHGYYFREGDEVPHCPKCWEDAGKAITLPAAVDYITDRGRICRVCKHHYAEGPSQRRNSGPTQVGGTWS
jgi:hypothetical protein